jgi:hypothetical protein
MNRIGTICRQRLHVVLLAATGNQAATRPSMSALTFQNSSGRSWRPDSSGVICDRAVEIARRAPERFTAMQRKFP